MLRKLVTLFVAVAAALLVAAPAFGLQALIWTGNGQISFATLDGSRWGDITVSGATVSGPQGIAVHPGTHKMYWANNSDGDGTIAFANLDGSAGGYVNTAGATVFTPFGVALDASAGRIYWVNGNQKNIPYASLSGSGVGALSTAGATAVPQQDVALDLAGGRIYWSEHAANKISYLNLNGTGAGDLAISGATVDNPDGVAVDPVAGRIYWANGSANKISFANLNGSGGVDMNTTGATVNGPTGVAIDTVGGRIYWTNFIGNKISFANLNGTGGGDVDTKGATVIYPRFIALFDLLPTGDLVSHNGLEACWSKAVSRPAFLGVLQAAVDNVTSCIPQTTASGGATLCGAPHCPGNVTGCPLTTHAGPFTGPPAPAPDYGNHYTSTGSTDDIVIDVGYSGGSCTITASNVTVDYALDFGMQVDGNNGVAVDSLDPPSFTINNGYTLTGSDATCQGLVNVVGESYLVSQLETQGAANIATLEKAATDGKSICPLTP